MLASLRHTSQTLDEGVHASAGYTFWHFNDYRFNPENGNLPQRIIGLPLLFGSYRFPPLTSQSWVNAQEWDLTWDWFYNLGNDADAMNLRGRAAVGLIAALLGFLVWRWSSQLFGEAGGIVSLLLYVMNPSILANGALMTSDITVSFFFLAAVWIWWKMLRGITAAHLLLSALATAGVILSKMSGVLIAPIILVLLIARGADPAPLSLSFVGERKFHRWPEKSLMLLGLVVAELTIVLIAVWASYGFRFSAFSPQMPAGQWTGDTWEAVLEKPLPMSLLERINLNSSQRDSVEQIFIRDGAEQQAWSSASVNALNEIGRDVLTADQSAHLKQAMDAPSTHFVPRILEWLRFNRLLPEAYIYGFAHAWHNSRQRAAFFNGDFSLSGWWTFFPYTFAVKTPLPAFVVIGVAIAAVVSHLRRGQESIRRSLATSFYRTLPLWTLFSVYWAVAICSHLNIGHRHILPTYPPLFVLCGAVGAWFSSRNHGKGQSRQNRRALFARVTVIIALVALLADVGYQFPHYIAYFNGIIRPARAYRHLVDSSLDWGQDLPQVGSYIRERKPSAPHLSYFGFANPVYYQIPAIYEYSAPNRYRTAPVRLLQFPASEADSSLAEFFRNEPDYDEQIVGRGRQGDDVFVVAIKKANTLRLTPGTYFISASLVQPITLPRRGAIGPWNARLEREYQNAVHLVSGLLTDDPALRADLLKRMPPEKWNEAISNYEVLRFHRLAAFLRQREPNDTIGGSILIYDLTADGLTAALDGPPPELGEDVASQEAAKLR